jgi:beta-catenin-like protein 1
MTSIDDLFSKPSSSVSTSNKRKFPDPSIFSSSPSSSTHKSAKLTTNGSPHTPTVEEDDDDIAAGPSLPRGTENDADADDEGRFFGSGVSADTRNALDYVESVEGEDGVAEELIDTAWLRKMAVGFERRITRNAELRTRFEGEPEKYVGLAPFRSSLARLELRDLD